MHEGLLRADRLPGEGLEKELAWRESVVRASNLTASGRLQANAAQLFSHFNIAHPKRKSRRGRATVDGVQDGRLGNLRRKLLPQELTV